MITNRTKEGFLGVSILAGIFAACLSQTVAQEVTQQQSPLLPPLEISPVPLTPVAPPPPEYNLLIGAAFAPDGPLIRAGLQWRVFQAQNLKSALKTSEDPIPVFQLDPGEYIVHVAYGLASSSKRIAIVKAQRSERMILAAGGLMVRGTNGGKEVRQEDLRVSVFIPSPTNSEEKLLSDNVPAGQILRLPEGIYHIVTVFSDSNSTVAADLRVQTGKLTEATLNHKAAKITLKLVSRAGSEAIANTAWTVLTPGGDVIREELGAFPSMVLAEGTYTAIARNDGKTFTSDFKVTGVNDQDIEILRQNTPRPTAPTR